MLLIIYITHLIISFLYKQEFGDIHKVGPGGIEPPLYNYRSYVLTVKL